MQSYISTNTLTNKDRIQIAKVLVKNHQDTYNFQPYVIKPKTKQ